MAETTYTYSIANDFPSGKVDAGRLHDEIQKSAITIALDGVNTKNDDCNIVFKDTLPAASKTILDNDTTAPCGGLIGSHSGDPIVEEEFKTDIHGNLKTVAQIPSGIEGQGFRYVSHNFCDSRTWWQDSDETVDGAMTANGSFTEYTINAQGGKIIDLRHALMTFEDGVTDTTVSPMGKTMSNLVPTVKVNDVALDQANEDADDGDDRYTIDYVNTKVVFAVARQSGDTVTISCRRATTSKYIFKPPTAKKWIFEDAEVDATEDIDMVAPFSTTIFGSHTTITGGAVVPLGSRTYKSFHDFHAAARRFYGPIPANFGGTGGVNSPKWTFEWQYNRADEFFDTENYLDQNGHPSRVTYNYAQTQVSGDVELGGGILTVTYYGQETSESGNGG